jgi:hypothetical protein
MRLRQLEADVGDLADTVTLTLERLNRLSARITARARVAAAAVVDDSRVAADPSGGERGAELADSEIPAMTDGEDRAALRERLRARWAEAAKGAGRGRIS